MSYLIALSLVTYQYMRSAGLRRLYCFLTNRTKIKILNYGQTKEVNQNVSTRSGRGNADPSFLLFFQENLLSCTFFIAFLNPVFFFQNIEVKKILIATKANKCEMQIGPFDCLFWTYAYWYFKTIAKTKQPFILQYAEAGWGKWNKTRRRHHTRGWGVF